jgi:pimeloyl-ACP methyl ester carboxylesterase
MRPADSARTRDWKAGANTAANLDRRRRPRGSLSFFHLFRWFLIGLGVWLFIGLGICFIALERFNLPAPTGPYAIGTTTLTLTDPSRPEPHDPSLRRTVVVQLWYPATPSSNPVASYQRWSETTLSTLYAPLLHTHSRLDSPIAPAPTQFPVLLFGPRWGGQRTQDTALAEDLASHGFVVAVVDHPYNAVRVQVNGKVITGNEALEGPGGPSSPAGTQITFWNSTLDLWAADNRFVLDQLAALNSTRFHNALDTNHAGAFGHSFGGAAAFRMLGLDPRIVSAVNLDGWTFGALASRTTQPIMLIDEQAVADREQELLSISPPGGIPDQLDRADNAAVESSLTGFGGYRLYVRGTQHLDFSDQPLLPPLRRLQFTGPIEPARIDTILRETVLGFFDQTLHNQPAAILNTPSSMPEVTIQHYSPAGK